MPPRDENAVGAYFGSVGQGSDMDPQRVRVGEGDFYIAQTGPAADLHVSPGGAPRSGALS